MTPSIGRWKGAILGALVISAALLSGVLEALLGPAVTVTFLFGGGLVAGLLTRGTVMDGAITGAVSGVLVGLFLASTATSTSLVASSPQYSPPWTTIGFYALVLTILLLPSNAVGGAVGTAVRNGIRGAGTPAGTIGAAERTRWLGIGVGTTVIAASMLFIGILGPLIAAVPLIGGFIAGFAAGGEARDGLEAGLVTALFGTGLFSFPLLLTASHAAGFVAGLAGMAAVALGYLFILFGTVGGVAGAVVRRSATGREDC